jgi:hypothetical protein
MLSFDTRSRQWYLISVHYETLESLNHFQRFEMRIFGPKHPAKHIQPLRKSVLRCLIARYEQIHYGCKEALEAVEAGLVGFGVFEFQFDIHPSHSL